MVLTAQIKEMRLMFYGTAWAGAPGVVQPSAVDTEGRHPKTAHLKTCQPCVT